MYYITKHLHKMYMNIYKTSHVCITLITYNKYSESIHTSVYYSQINTENNQIQIVSITQTQRRNGKNIQT